MSPNTSPKRRSERTTRRRPTAEDVVSPGDLSSPASQNNTPLRDHQLSPLASSPAYDDGQGLMSPQTGLARKKSLVRNDRRPVDANQRDYYYRKHALGMNVHPSTTGADPTADDEAITVSSESTEMKSLAAGDRRLHTAVTEQTNEKTYDDRRNTKLQRKVTVREKKRDDDLRRQRERAAVVPLSPWVAYCRVVTFWCPDVLLRCFGMPSKPQQRAWREKMGLISIIVFICAFVGYLTFGFTLTVCPPGANQRLRTNKIDRGYMIFNGKAYDLSKSKHPLARNIQENSNVVFDLPYGGYDGSFLFQNVNGACKGLINRQSSSSMPTDSSGNLAWYFPCVPFKQDGSDKPDNISKPEYIGYQCHTSRTARETFYGLHHYGDVYFTWDDVRNKSRNLMVYGSDVLDLNLLTWFNGSDVSYPVEFDQIRQNVNLRGKDVTTSFRSAKERQMGRCLTQIIRVGSVDTASIGCIASKVVLYVSLVFILAIVLSKFFLALAYQWFISPKYGAAKTAFGKQSKKDRAAQIEEWSEDIYKAPPKINDPAGGAGDRSSKRGSVLFPRTSRFTSPYQIDQAQRKAGTGPITMANQSTNSRVASGMYKQSNRSEMTIDGPGRNSIVDSRSSIMLGGAEYNEGPAGFIHDKVVPQPPAEYQPFGYPLVHAICLVTAYSEGYEGIRATLDSIARTEYPNSHKIILVICDGQIRGHGEKYTTPEICLSMMKDNIIPREQVQPFSYVAVASGSKRHNMARIHAGFYDYGEDSRVPHDDQKRVPMIVVQKVGTEAEAASSKPGNRGKRDSQIILMSFLQKVMFDERMTELEYEMFNGMWKVTGISPDYYEVCMMVDADTNVFPDSLTHMVSAMVKDPQIMGLCGETKIANKRSSWVTMIQVFE
jgi:chitin synthase